MDKALETPLRKFVEAYATQSTENADELIHEYICKKAQKMLLGEADEEEAAETDKEEADEDCDDKDEADKDGDKKSDKKDKKDKDDEDSVE